MKRQLCDVTHTASAWSRRRYYFLVLARSRRFVDEKISELESLGIPFKIVCGEKIDHPNVIYRKPAGKYDAINFGANQIPGSVDVVGLTDVDTRIHNLSAALRDFEQRGLGLLYAKIVVSKGPQRIFLSMLDKVRRAVPIAANGELMLIRRDIFNKILPLRPCKAEDTYILFRALELKVPIAFFEECFLQTETTSRPESEEVYKRRTVTGIYQALRMTNPPALVKALYLILPFASPLLLVLGRRGYYFAKGILLGFLDYVRGEKGGSWLETEKVT